MILSRKLTVATVVGVIASGVVYLAEHYFGIVLDVEQVMLPLVGLAAAAGFVTKEDRRVLENLELTGRHRLTVSDLVTLHQADKVAPPEADDGELAPSDPDPARQPEGVTVAWRDPAPRTEADVEKTMPGGRLAAEFHREDRSLR